MKNIATIVCTLLLLAGCNKAPPVKEQQGAATADYLEKSKARFNQWAYIAKEKQIAPGETLKLVIIPDALGFEILDTKCLLYSNSEYKQISMICPGATQESIKEVEQ
jgi:hypothetical protein